MNSKRELAEGIVRSGCGYRRRTRRSVARSIALGLMWVGACVGLEDLVPFPQPDDGCPSGTLPILDEAAVAQCWSCGALAARDPATYCDDGNSEDDDGCDSNCTPTACGNGVETKGLASQEEECDDGNIEVNDNCVFCRNAKCGDGATWVGEEECDDGNGVAHDGCENNCLTFDNAWAQWPMPNSPGSPLPNDAAYDVSTPNVVRDLVTRLVWQREAQSEPLDWATAASACSSLELGGWSDWRLPSLIELISIVDYARNTPAMDAETFQGSLVGEYWTSSPSAIDTAKAWCVLIDTGSTVNADKFSPRRFRCVRGPEAPDL
jgi:cysteine-rich repeat protein